MQQGSKDPRVTKLEFLSYVDKRGQADFTLVDGQPLEQSFGLPSLHFKQMLVLLILEGCVNGYGAENVYDGLIRGTPDYNLTISLEQMGRGFLTAKLSHKGRVRLWQLKDELESLRRMEDFGILFAKEHAKRDWSIRSAFLKDGDPISLIYCDLDHFKSVNDTFNHSVGDDALKTYLRTLKNPVGDFGESYRMGGDEVSVILPALPLDKAMELGESIRKNVEAEMKSMAQLEMLKSKPTTSVGVATFFGKVPAESAFDQADKLAYKSKTGDRNRVTASACGK